MSKNMLRVYTIIRDSRVAKFTEDCVENGPGTKITSTLEFLIIVYTRNMFFDKISLLHAVIKHYTIFTEAPVKARFFFHPEIL